ncbi:hypothetical protein [Wenzhouxiangella sp. XN24]|uniref:hypothetical protein n=1 Tax=Wenzhouxiangella sp. XN24 TaxID=2713569 RepID=UPI0013EAA300|nr:hypothetical protein [Wenzhouxiangella sp. XN24]NGX16367.1 hypothetical protein [Wenzhouxiangella sp. XN24]
MKQNPDVSPLCDPAIRTNGHAYLGNHRSRRPIWSVELSAATDATEAQATRRFFGIGGATVSEEISVLSPEGSLLQVTAHQPYLEEEAFAHIRSAENGQSTIHYRLSVNGMLRERTERVRLPVVTLSFLPLFAGLHAAELLAGRMIKARFPVLKVMRSATVVLRAHRTPGGADVQVTPTSPLLRLLFGTTVYRFDAGLAVLLGYRGLLDPRDRKHNGRWHEYLGSIDLARPLPLPGC